MACPRPASVQEKPYHDLPSAQDKFSIVPPLCTYLTVTATLVLGAVPKKKKKKNPLNHFKPEFMKTVGTQFTLDGSRFTVVGCALLWYMMISLRVLFIG